MRCPVCGFENPEGFRFCGSCGTTFGQACPSCGAEVPAGFRFCGVCGQAVDEVQEEDPHRFARAAGLYAGLELPYQEARCLLEAGDLERASRIIERFGLEDGPLGARLRVLRPSAG